MKRTASALHTPLTNPHTEASISYQMNLGEFRGNFSNLIFTELAKGITVLKGDLFLIVFEDWEFSIWWKFKKWEMRKHDFGDFLPISYINK